MRDTFDALMKLVIFEPNLFVWREFVSIIYKYRIIVCQIRNATALFYFLRIELKTRIIILMFSLNNIFIIIIYFTERFTMIIPRWTVIFQYIFKFLLLSIFFIWAHCFIWITIWMIKKYHPSTIPFIVLFILWCCEKNSQNFE